MKGWPRVILGSLLLLFLKTQVGLAQKPFDDVSGSGVRARVAVAPLPGDNTPTYADSPRPEHVLVVYNKSYRGDENQNGMQDSYEIARLYQAARGIPEINICGISAPTQEVISRWQYDGRFDTENSTTPIRQALEEYLSSHFDAAGNLLRGTIRYIVLTKGIPLKISQYDGLSDWGFADYSSVDAAVALLFQDYSIDWRFANPYYGVDPEGNLNYRFRNGHFSNHEITLSYLVTRLDGYSLADVERMIERAVNADTSGTAWWVIDDHQKPYGYFQQAHDLLASRGLPVLPDPWSDDLNWIVTAPGPVMGYVSHGFHAGMPDDYVSQTLQFDYANGAVFTTYESFNAFGFLSPDQNNQGQVAEFIHAGGTGGIGNVFEPWASGIANEAFFFGAYAAGYPLADAAYMAIPFLDFTSVVVGDPLTTIRPTNLPEVAIQEGPRLLAVTPEPEAQNVSPRPTIALVFSTPMDSSTVSPLLISPSDGAPWTTTWKGTTLYLIPGSSLSAETRYTIRLPESVRTATGQPLTNDPVISFSTGLGTIDESAPTVLYHEPDGIGVAEGHPITIIFSKAMQRSSVQFVQFTPAISGTFTWRSDAELIIIPDALVPGTDYTVTVQTHALDAAGNGLKSAFRWSFRTTFTALSADLDQDGLLEWARNLDGDDGNGYETYSDQEGNLSRAVASIDGDGDLLTDHFIDLDGDDWPDVYWDPDFRGAATGPVASKPLAGIPSTRLRPQSTMRTKRLGLTSGLDQSGAGLISLLHPIDYDNDGSLEFAYDSDGDGADDRLFVPGGAIPIRPLTFRLLRVEPPDGATDVSLQPTLQLWFSRPVAATAVAGALQIDPYQGGGQFLAQDGERRILFTPGQKLAPATTYQVTLDGTLKDRYGASLDTLVSWIFTTADSAQADQIPPAVVATVPANGARNVARQPIIAVTFSEPMDTTSLAYLETVPLVNGSWQVTWQGNSAYFTLPEPLQPGTRYTVTVPVTARDLAGNNLTTPYPFTFQVRAADQVTPPYILSQEPIGDRVASDHPIRIRFSESMVRQTVEDALVIDPPVAGSSRWANDAELVFTPDRLAFRTWYQVTVAGSATSQEGITMGQTFTWSFRTESPWVARDLDGDGAGELALDADDEPGNGLEVYLDTVGIRTSVVWSGDARGDSLTGHFIDLDHTGTPELLWVPQVDSTAGVVYPLQVSDDDQDGNAEYLYDGDGDGYLELAFDPDETPPIRPAVFRILTVFPPDSQTTVGLFSSIEVQFSAPVEPVSAINALRSTPKLPEGRFGLYNQGRLLRYTPELPFNPETTYQMAVEATVQDTSGRTLLQGWAWVFTTGSGDSTLASMAPPTLQTIDRLDGTRIQLTWSALPGAIAYEVYRNSLPRFDSDDAGLPIATVTDTAFIDDTDNGVGESDRNTFYAVRARSAGGVSDFSNLVGAIDWPLQNIPGTLSENVLPLILDPRWRMAPLDTLASALGQAIPGVRAVARWDGALQGWIEATRLDNEAGWLNDFPVHQGDVIHLKMDRSTIYTWTGALPDSTQFQLHTKANTLNDNPFYVPLLADTIGRASDLGARIPGAFAVAVWITASQSWNEATYLPDDDLWLNDFELRPGQPVYVKVDTPVKLVTLGEREFIAFSETSKKTVINTHPLGKPAGNAGGLSHNVIWKMVPAGGEGDLPPHLKIQAWLSNRPQERLQSGDPGVAWEAGYGLVNVGNLPSGWSYGDTLIIQVTEGSQQWTGRIALPLGPRSGNVPRLQLQKANSRLPSDYALEANYPNPFNPATQIRYRLPQAAHVQLVIYNLLGQVVRTLVDTRQEAGYYTVRWNGWDDQGAPVASGTYLYRLQVGRFSQTRKMSLVR